MITSFFDLVRSGAASFDAPAIATEDVAQLVHAAIDLLPPSAAADLVAERPSLDVHSATASWAELVGGHDLHAGSFEAGGVAAHSHDDDIDFGAGAQHRDAMFDDSSLVGGHAAPGFGHDALGPVEGGGAYHGGLADGHRDDGHDHHGHTLDHHGDHWHDDAGHGLSEGAGHEHTGLHDSVLHPPVLHGPDGDQLGELGHPGHGSDDDDGGPRHDGGWHAE